MRLMFPNGEHPQVDLENGVYVIGSGQGSHIALRASSVLAKHATLQFNQGNATLSPGTPDAQISVSGNRISGATEFKPGDVLEIGDVRIRVLATDKANTGPTVPISVKRQQDDENDGRTRLRSALPKFMLRGVSGPTFGKVFPLVGVTVIGRAPECDISIPTDEISRRHAELRISQDGVMVEDLGSANGTFVNDRRVTRELLKHGDELRFDQLRFQLIAPGKEMMQSPNAGGAAPAAPTPSTEAPTGGLPNSVWVVLIVVSLVVLYFAARFAKVF